jgi:peptidoglycan/LPS O-acetylase OafA/YrhL
MLMNADKASRFRPDIEGLRGIAVLMVVAFHCGVPYTSGGFVGVDVFFVLSGYLITGILVAEIRKTGKLNLFDFYARRARRLLPASALTLAITLLIGAWILSPPELSFAGRAGRAAALYASNMFFATNAADYFAPNVKSNPLLHTWSLAVEEQFYLFWPLLILLGLRVWRSAKALLTVEAAVTVLSLGACLWWTARGGPFAFYQLPARAWEFGIGGIAVLIPRGALLGPCGARKFPSGCWAVLGRLGILAILASGSVITGEANFPGWIALIPVLGTAVALVASAECPDRGARPMLSGAPLQRLGKLSYSWYLWHWPLLVFATALFPQIPLAGKISVAAASLGVAAATHHLFENPIRFHPYLVRHPAFCIGLAAMVTVISLSVAAVSLRLAGRLASAPGMKAIAAAADDIAAMPRQQCVALGESAAVKTCVFGEPISETNIVLFGDSHAIQWFNPLRQMAASHGWKLTTMVKSGCPAADIVPPNASRKFAATCADWRAAAIRSIVALNPTVVFVGNASIYLERSLVKPAVPIEDWRRGTRHTLEALSRAGLAVAVMRDNPIPAFDIPACLARSMRHSATAGACAMHRSAVLNPAIFEAEQAGARDLPHVHFIDLTDQFCSSEVCWAMREGEVLYRDDNHLTGRAAARLEPVIEARLIPIVNGALGNTASRNKPWAYAKSSFSR